MEEPLLRVEKLSIRVGGRDLVRDVDFELERTGILGIAGPSGCGKTTLLRTIAGLVDAGAGRVLVEGREASEMGWPLFRRRVVYQHQRPVMLPGKVRENLVRPFSFRAVDGPFPESRAMELLDRTGLGDIMDRPAADLSVGEQQRVCLVRSLIVDPAVLLLDEPTSALDAQSASIVESIVEDTVDGGMGVVLVTHDQAQTERCCGNLLRIEAEESGFVARLDGPGDG